MNELKISRTDPDTVQKMNARPRKRWGQAFLKSWQLQVLFLLPLIYLLVFKYYPMYGAQIAFRDFVAIKGITGSDWVGLKYFSRFFHSYEFWRVLRNTLGLAFYQLFAGFPFPIILALSLNYVHRVFFKKSVQMITYAPHFISVVVMVGIIMQLLDPRTGLVNQILTSLGFDAIHFLARPELFKSIFVWSDIWQNVGWGCIIYLAALSSIDPTLHEAAIMDGASKVRRIWHIDLPGILPIAMIMFILNMGNLMDIGFEKVLLLQTPLNLRTAEVIDTYVYKVGLASNLVNFSYASAIGLFKSVVNLILIVTINYTAKRMRQETLW
ncbi:ABC transporter permease [Paenibacillus sp. 1P07SE]|uniref:ABC transporter permease n=1 Tax=Paenibacillus sp. 1P07SE TaxID=3132209 RepID=UPI0039A4E6F5